MRQAEAKLAIGKGDPELKQEEDKKSLTQAEKPEKSVFDNINKSLKEDKKVLKTNESTKLFPEEIEAAVKQTDGKAEKQSVAEVEIPSIFEKVEKTIKKD